MSIRNNCPCDIDGVCPYEDMHSGYFGSCEYWCGSIEPQDDPESWEPEIWEDDDEYIPSATYGDYSPSCPWNAPGMTVQDFI